jgi:hypothetical protein
MSGACLCLAWAFTWPAGGQISESVVYMADNITNFVFSYLRDFYGVREEAVAGSDSLGFVEKIKRVHQGLSAEHEFAAIASWLGRCSLLTQLDSVLHVSERYRVPDFLVVVERQGKDVPFLVEIKTDNNYKLVWSQAYMASMRDFAALLKPPLLVACPRSHLPPRFFECWFRNENRTLRCM